MRKIRKHRRNVVLKMPRMRRRYSEEKPKRSFFPKTAKGAKAYKEALECWYDIGAWKLPEPEKGEEDRRYNPNEESDYLGKFIASSGYSEEKPKRSFFPKTAKGTKAYKEALECWYDIGAWKLPKPEKGEDRRNPEMRYNPNPNALSKLEELLSYYEFDRADQRKIDQLLSELWEQVNGD